MDDIEVLKAFVETLERQRSSVAADESPCDDEQTLRVLSSAYLRLAKDLIKLDAGEESLAAGRNAVCADPDNLDAVFFLLDRLEKLNQIDEAWATLLAVEDRQSTPYASCGKLYFMKACLEYRRGHLKMARGMFEEFINKDHGRPRVTLAYGWLGKTLDRLGFYDEAMEAITHYNTLAAATPEALEMAKEGEKFQAGIEASTRWYRNKTSFEWREASSRKRIPSPVLLVGFPRSGTTLLEQILSAHSMLQAVDERPTLEGIEDRFFGSETQLLQLQKLTSRDAEACRQAYWANVARYVSGVPGGRRLVVDKFPLNIVHLDIYARLFPGVRIVVALRDPRDSVLSNYFQTFSLNPAMVANLELSSSAQQYARVMALYQVFRNFIPGNIYEIRYESLVGDFRNECSRLLDFLGLEWEDGLDRYYETASQRWIRTASYQQVVKPLYSDAIGRWKNYAHYLEAINPLLQPFIESFGYL